MPAETRQAAPSYPNVVTFLFKLSHRLKYRVLMERLAVCRLASDEPIPAWATNGGFFSVVRTPNELSIVCREGLCPEARMPEGRVPDGKLIECGWVALQLQGPFPFS